jgi:hypothetical protein
MRRATKRSEEDRDRQSLLHLQAWAEAKRTIGYFPSPELLIEMILLIHEASAEYKKGYPLRFQVFRNGSWEMDFESLEDAAQERLDSQRIRGIQS